MLQQTTASKQLPIWRGNVKNLDAQAAILWGQVMRAVRVSGYNLVAPPGARGATADWVREGIRMQRCHSQNAAPHCPELPGHAVCAAVDSARPHLHFACTFHCCLVVASSLAALSLTTPVALCHACPQTVQP